MSKTKRSGHTARIAALEKELRLLRAGIRKDIIHAVRHEVSAELSRQQDAPRIVFHSLGADSYSERVE